MLVVMDTSRLLILIALLVVTQCRGQRDLRAHQRGDQGPDDDHQSLDFITTRTDSTKSRSNTLGLRGPNVCGTGGLMMGEERRTWTTQRCCPGWTIRPFTSLCLMPICVRGCGEGGRCIKPNLCICDNGRLAIHCDSSSSSSMSESSKSSSVCDVTCLNGGTCSGNGTCVCRAGFAGSFCQEPICKRPCRNGGRCIGPNRCACVYGYTGRVCEIDYRTGPCYRSVDESGVCGQVLSGVVCTRQMCCATLGKAWGHPCSLCPEVMDCESGFLRNVHTDACMDINECEAVPNLCDNGHCVNTIGSFHCECGEGRHFDDTKAVCVDTDECQTQDICRNGTCVNRKGGYVCLCDPGFIPSQDQKACLDTQQGVCYTRHHHRVSEDVLVCRQPLAFELSKLDCCCANQGRGMGSAWAKSQGEECQVCPLKGSEEFEKLCLPAASLVDLMELDECNLRSDLCPNGHCIDTAQGYECECESGYALSSGQCVDVDECETHCIGGSCRNTPGNFECECGRGLHLSKSGKECIDHDECQTSGVCSNGMCINYRGSFKCLCDVGFELSPSGMSCIDVDECKENLRICLHGKCVNTQGSYKCECDSNFVLAPNKAFCVDINECVEHLDICKHGQCFNLEGSFRCVCDPGFELVGQTCLDIDECVLNNPCIGGQCTNTPGGFQCACPQGFNLGADGRTCDDTTLGLCYTWLRMGSECSNPLSNLMSRSTCCCGQHTHLSRRRGFGTMPCRPCPMPDDDEHSVLCPHGPGFTHGGDDINECVHDRNLCRNGACENLIGGFRCVCHQGFVLHEDNSRCVDIDECNANHDDNYYYYDDYYDNHQDETSKVCGEARCQNTVGSFKCICGPGFQYQEATRSCVDIDECRDNVINDDNVVTNDDNVVTNDDVGVCGPGGRCVNTVGNFHCECPEGFVANKFGFSNNSMDTFNNEWKQKNANPVCVEVNKGRCWRFMDTGDDRCEDNLQKLVSKEECCCSLGQAWGSPCQKCDRLRDCGHCPQGLMQSGLTCVDVDECVLESNLCGAKGICVNTHGSFMCRCPPGLTLRESECVDERLEPCHLGYALSTCSNSLGSQLFKKNICCCTIGKAWGHHCEKCPAKDSKEFSALCGPERIDGHHGYVDNIDVNECLAFPHLCSNGHCTNTLGSYECVCHQGFAYNPDTLECSNIDECQITEGLCGNGTCVDTPGAFECHCKTGFEVSDFMQVCVDIDECALNSTLCRGGLCLNTVGSFECECPMGLELSKEEMVCKDVDECSMQSDVCSNGICMNLMGAYQCICDAGFEQSGNGISCMDIDECSNNNGDCDQLCINSPGSFSCACNIGFVLKEFDQRKCEDVDECRHDENPCNGGHCINTIGSYHCQCGEGLRDNDLSDTNPKCLDVDECLSHDCGNGHCENTLGSFACICEEGFTMNSEEEKCLDEDECLLELFNCDVNARCINTQGGYDCLCKEGFEGDGKQCRDVNECLISNGDCDEHARCVNLHGSHRCICDQGFKQDSHGNCTDRDECVEEPELCRNGVCVNTLGSFLCECQLGFAHPDTELKQQCEDVDECLMGDICLNGQCENMRGSFRCLCNAGFTLDDTGNNCTDIDECLDPMVCRFGDCINQLGDFLCNCPLNYTLVENKNGCVDNRLGSCYVGDDCLETSLSLLSSSSSRSSCCCSSGGSWSMSSSSCERCPEASSEAYTQLCPGGKGFQPNPDTLVLEDINECLELEDVCRNGRCSNTFGSFMCTCSSGFVLDTSKLECVDIDECVDQEDICGSNGQCVNLEGSFECVCPPDFMLASDNQECIDIRKGLCSTVLKRDNTTCSRPMSRLQTRLVCCCTLGIGWSPSFDAECQLCPQRDSEQYARLCGPESSEGTFIDPVSGALHELDECQLMPGICQNGRCLNTMGSFTCECQLGFVHDQSSHQCVDINECSGNLNECGGNARCVNIVGSFRCVCPSGYSLSSNQRECLDIDECQEISNVCSNGHCSNVGGSFECHCDDGFVLNTAKDRCLDLDECQLNPRICGNGTCVNTFGSFRCECDEGFQRRLKGDECEDINECEWQIHLCRNGRCVNTLGSYLCECHEGFEYDERTKRCVDINECSKLCSWPGICTNLIGSFECTCPKGFKLNENKMCEDIDECLDDNSFCSGGFCTNILGSARCECPDDFVLDADNECVDARRGQCFYHDLECTDPGGNQELKVGFNRTKEECCCTTAKAFKAFRNNFDDSMCEACPTDEQARKRLCPFDEGRRRDGNDIDECLIDPTLCTGGQCVNTDGSFRCECESGFQLERESSRCLDIDECVESQKCGKGQCLNNVGSFECVCDVGFVVDRESGLCVDLDECRLWDHECAFRCHNTEGSFTCICPFGYELDSDQRHCVDVDECGTEANECPYECKNLIGSFVCVCPSGFVDVDNVCVDVDECRLDQNICGPNGKCVNTEGAFVCECVEGFERSEDNKKCIDKRRDKCHSIVDGRGRCRKAYYYNLQDNLDNDDHVTYNECCCTLQGAAWGQQCQLCPLRGSSALSTLCRDSGFDQMGDDIDECLLMADRLCEHGRCVNTLGSFRCICDKGFKPDHEGKECVDIDECHRRPGPCEHTCVNTFGSFQCTCPTGYTLSVDNRRCLDIDECEEESEAPCQFECVNTQGSFRCVCPKGLRQEGDQGKCVDVDECREHPGLCPPPAVCRNLHGSFRCVCPRGFVLEANGAFCEDVDECLQQACPQDTVCHNTIGSFKCGCDPGWRLDVRTEQCEDIDECALNLDNCSSMEDNVSGPCQNAIGGFACVCPLGYNFHSALAICVQASLGCSRSTCLFGCQAVGGDDEFVCACPDQYLNQRETNVCIRANDNLDLHAFEEEQQPIEGCFACNQRERRQQRRRRRPRGRRSPQQRPPSSKEIEHDQIESSSLVLRTSASTTRWRRPLLFWQSSSSSFSSAFVLEGEDAALFALTKSTNGIWSLHYRRRVYAHAHHRVRVQRVNLQDDEVDESRDGQKSFFDIHVLVHS